MAGGSSNAAAVLFGMNRMYELNLSMEELKERGVTLGADVPYCIMRGTVLAEGIGEILTPLAPMPRCHILIAKPPLSASTKVVYEKYDAMTDICHPDIDGIIAGLEADMATLATHPHPEDGFAGMTIGAWSYSDRESAGEAILELCGDVKGTEPVEIGAYRGFTVYLAFSGFKHEVILKGAAVHRVELGEDARGNLIRMDNALSKMPQRLQETRETIEDLLRQCEAAKAELAKPFPQEEELRVKSARLAMLDAQLNIGRNTAA